MRRASRFALFYRARRLSPIAAPVKSLLATAALVAIAGCELRQFESLAYRCQFEECVCVSDQASLPRRPEFSDVLWRETGDAYCAPGFVLRTPAQLTANTVAERRKAFRETR